MKNSVSDSEPFLLKFAEETGSPPDSELGEDYYFDQDSDLLRSKNHPEELPAIEIEGEDGPDTKKNDVEKGDDNKDRGMWV
ncbi:hypothetical protein [Haloarcula marismortui]|uniref:Uncharacterized protein n=1 Tax=Haloarcula marismortui ATCC 33800 TaxID=662476 RepID=M0K3H3_9EURY|nr:hypothetical protein [Haloarcula sinaiiensis]EMA14669.1 hypothetical protein C436_05541 [Haloarcula sinaiiensis ATCC 33800]QUJ71922.1 hypothetical protein KDQ40_14705 [Haloarcula sinaiiensis ATCC 33800]